MLRPDIHRASMLAGPSLDDTLILLIREPRYSFAGILPRPGRVAGLLVQHFAPPSASTSASPQVLLSEQC